MNFPSVVRLVVLVTPTDDIISSKSRILPLFHVVKAEIHAVMPTEKLKKKKTIQYQLKLVKIKYKQNMYVINEKETRPMYSLQHCFFFVIICLFHAQKHDRL